MARPSVPQRGVTEVQPGPVALALRKCRSAFWGVAIFSGVVNLLMLAGPLYMLQVYDRVLASRSVPTLIALSVVLVGAYAFQALLDAIRGRVVTRVARLLDNQLEDAVFRAGITLAAGNRSADSQMVLRDVDQIRAFLTGSGPIAIVDSPWVPVFLLICFLIHPVLGLLSLAGAIILFITTLLTERASREPARAMSTEGAARSVLAEANRRNSETIVAMGMAPALSVRWSEANGRYLAAAERATDVGSSFGSFSKVMRLILQSAILGVGAYLVINQGLSAGAMIAASIMMSRALAPIEVAIANWRSFVSARQSYRRLDTVLAALALRPRDTALPRPQHRLDVTELVVGPPDTRTPIVARVEFALTAGQSLGIIGNSGAGKTSVGRTLAGIWSPLRGTVRLDGAALDQWDPDVLGASIGYISQSVELFDGTIAENIARMQKQPDSDAVIAAARLAGAHDLILSLPAGYDTPIGTAGAILSAGQRQRVALARAVFGNPFLLILDEPNSNLDHPGDTALLDAVRALKLRGAIVVIIAHRPSVMDVCDKLVFLGEGVQKHFDDRDVVLAKVRSGNRPTPPQPPVPPTPPVPPGPPALQRPLQPGAAGLRVVNTADARRTGAPGEDQAAAPANPAVRAEVRHGGG